MEKWGNVRSGVNVYAGTKVVSICMCRKPGDLFGVASGGGKGGRVAPRKDGRTESEVTVVCRRLLLCPLVS